MDNKERLARLAALLDGDESAALEFIKECKAVRKRNFVTFIDKHAKMEYVGLNITCNVTGTINYYATYKTVK